MNEDRRKILEMLAAGKITADEAERLISAVEGAPASAAPAKPKYLRVVVQAEEGQPQNPTIVNIRVPMQLLRAGVRLAGLIPPQAREHVNEAMREHGIPMDLSQIRPENLEEMIDQLGELTVDVDHREDGVKVQVFCE